LAASRLPPSDMKVASRHISDAGSGNHSRRLQTAPSTKSRNHRHFPASALHTVAPSPPGSPQMCRGALSRSGHLHTFCPLELDSPHAYPLVEGGGEERRGEERRREETEGSHDSEVTTLRNSSASFFPFSVFLFRFLFFCIFLTPLPHLDFPLLLSRFCSHLSCVPFPSAANPSDLSIEADLTTTAAFGEFCLVVSLSSLEHPGRLALFVTPQLLFTSTSEYQLTAAMVFHPPAWVPQLPIGKAIRRDRAR
jgi:hypothetical protein